MHDTASFLREAKNYANATYPGFWEVMARNARLLDTESQSQYLLAWRWVDQEWEDWNDALAEQEP